MFRVFDVYRKGRLIGDAIRRYRGLFSVGFIAIIVVNVLDVLLPLFLKGIVDSIEAKNLPSIKWNCAVYLVIALIQAVCRIFWRVGFYQMSCLVACDLRRQIQQHLFKLPLRNFSQKRTGETITLAQSDTEAVRILVEHGMVAFFDGFIYIVGIPIILFWLSPSLAVVTLIILPLIPYLVARFQRSLKDGARLQQETLGALTRVAFENFSAIRLIKSFVAEADFERRFATKSHALVKASVLLSRKEAFFTPSLELVISISIVSLLFFGSTWIAAGAISIGTFVAFERYLHRLLWPAQAIGVWLSYLQRATASSERIEQFLSEPIEETHAVAAKPDISCPIALRVSEVSFSYESSANPVVRDVSFDIRRGERVAIVGPTGGGKSTIVQILLGVLQPSIGKIELFGADYSGLTVAELSQVVASVEQQPFLFSDTIYNNISPTQNISEIEKLTNAAALAREITSFPDGLQTLLGERGVTLSGGQRQRVAIARSLARKSPVLILDNALSAVDLITEKKIIQTIRELPEDVTALITTHRLSTTRLMDRIIVLNHGTIVQQGSHQELIQDRAGWYAEFCRKQELMQELHIEEGINE